MSPEARLGHLRLRPVADEDGFSAPIDGQLRAFGEPGDIHRDCRQSAHIRRRVHLIDQRPERRTGGDDTRASSGIIQETPAVSVVGFIHSMASVQPSRPGTSTRVL